MEKLKKVYKWICKLEELIAGAFLSVIMMVIFATGVGRSLGHPLNWGIDLSTFLFAWAAFFSADAALRKNRHVNVKFLVNKLPDNVQYYLAIINYLIIIVFLGFLIRYGIIQTYATRFRSFQGIPGFSYAWATLSVPIGAALLLITTITKIRQVVKTEKAKIFRMKVIEKYKEKVEESD